MKSPTLTQLLCAITAAAMAAAVPAAAGNRLSAGADHLLLLRDDGSLWGAGADRYGQLGTLDAQRPLPGNVSPLPRNIGPEAWARVSAGVDYSLAVRADSSLWVFGRNGSAQLGVERSESASAPMPMDGRWLDVAAGDAVSVGIAADGTMHMWGEWKTMLSNAGRSGGRKGRPRQVAMGAWSTVEMGADHALALRGDGTLWAMGDNGAGQTGCEASAAGRTLCAVGSAVGSAVGGAGGAAGKEKWTGMAAGERFSVAIREDSTLWSWGNNAMGQLGRGTLSEREGLGQVGSERWIAVSAGAHHVLAIRADGTLWAWGAGGNGALGVGTTGNQAAPVQVGYDKWTSVSAGKGFSAALRADGEFLIWGDLGFMQGPGTESKNPIALRPAYLDRKLTVNPIGPVILGGRDPVIGFVANHWDSVSISSGNPALLQAVQGGLHPLAAGRGTMIVKAFSLIGGGRDTLTQIRTVTVAKARQAAAPEAGTINPAEGISIR
jgi:alpha-tubulin suppressor-like RCC1 family protein